MLERSSAIQGAAAGALQAEDYDGMAGEQEGDGDCDLNDRLTDSDTPLDTCPLDDGVALTTDSDEDEANGGGDGDDPPRKESAITGDTALASADQRRLAPTRTDQRRPRPTSADDLHRPATSNDDKRGTPPVVQDRVVVVVEDESHSRSRSRGHSPAAASPSSPVLVSPLELVSVAACVLSYLTPLELAALFEPRPLLQLRPTSRSRSRGRGHSPAEASWASLEGQGAADAADAAAAARALAEVTSKASCKASLVRPPCSTLQAGLVRPTRAPTSAPAPTPTSPTPTPCIAFSKAFLKQLR